MFLDDAKIMFACKCAHRCHIRRVGSVLRGEFLSRELSDAAISRGKRRSTCAQYLRCAPSYDDADLESLGWIGRPDYSGVRDRRAFASFEDHIGHERAPLPVAN
jgi:hypothetical protein